MRSYAALVLALGSAIVSGVTVASYMFGLPALRTWAHPPMAVNTGLCLLALSFSCALVATRNGNGGK